MVLNKFYSIYIFFFLLLSYFWHFIYFSSARSRVKGHLEIYHAFILEAASSENMPPGLVSEAPPPSNSRPIPPEDTPRRTAPLVRSDTDPEWEIVDHENGPHLVESPAQVHEEQK